MIAALVGGFETVNKSLVLALLPLLLDLFFWLGPQLSIKPLLDDTAQQLAQVAAEAPEGSLAAQIAGQWSAIDVQADQFNLFWLLSTAPLGVPSTMARRIAETAGAHGLGVWGVSNGLLYLGLLAVFNVIGVFAGAVYFECIAQQVREGSISIGQLLRRVWIDWLQMIALALAGLIVILVLGVPALALTMVLTALNAILGSAALALAFSVLFWLLVFGIFALHGITLGRRNLFVSLWESIRLVQMNLAPTIGLVTVVMLLYFGLGSVWALAPTDSWINVIGIAGHAVVSTALVAATFVYYQDRMRWWQELRSGRAARLRA